MQQHGSKIQELIKKKGLIQHVVARSADWDPTSFSRKLREGEDFNPDDLRVIAGLLGVKPEFLDNKEFVYSRKMPIPPDAIAQPPAQPESNPLAAAANALAKAVESGVGNAPMNKAMQEMMDYLKRVDSKLDLLLEEKVGNHDPD